MRNTTLEIGHYRNDYFLGSISAAMRRLEKFVNRVAPLDETVLITGESGTGKAELARVIHHLSLRGDGPFITVSCAALPESLSESELPGYAERTHQGTLLLNELDVLTPSAQTRLVQFLQEKIIGQAGGNGEVGLDARIIAATSRDLYEAVENKTFRKDLYYRMNILECCVIPLRYRKEDLPVLVHRFIKEAAARQEKTAVPSIPDAVMQKLLEYNWPGNIRELKNTLERMIILTSGAEVEEAVLPPAILFSKEDRHANRAGLKTLEEVEREHIITVLAREQNLEKAAGILGIATVTLWRKRRQYGLL